MGNSLLYTSSCFMYSTGVTASVNANTKYDILTSSSSDRRLYGIALLSSDNATQTIKIYLTSATTSVVYQISSVSIPAGSGTNGTTPAVDVFASTMGESIFQKTRDPNGLAYFNVPANWKIQMDFNTTLGLAETITTHVFGEIY
jgi:hypothetical protein